MPRHAIDAAAADAAITIRRRLLSMDAVMALRHADAIAPTVRDDNAAAADAATPLFRCCITSCYAVATPLAAAFSDISMPPLIF